MSQLQIAILDGQLMLWLNKEQVSLGPEEAFFLYEQLDLFLEACNKKDQNIGEMTVLQERLNAAHQAAVQDNPLSLPSIFSNIEQDEGFRKAWEHGVSVYGEELFFNLVASCWQVDQKGWADLKNNVSKRHLLMLMCLTAWAPEGHILDDLWKSGAFDAHLMRIGDSLSAEDVPTPIVGRMLRLLTQEQPVASGSFLMGNDSEEAWRFEQPEHLVELSCSFSAMIFPVTQILYRSVMQVNPSSFAGASHPVESVSWREALLFCNTLSLQQGYQPAYESLDASVPIWNDKADGYRLPTEAEWEFMALSFSECRFAGSHKADQVAWFASNSQGATHGVGLKQPNLLGLYDLSGNVWEWCWDGYSADFYASAQSGLDPKGEKDCLERVCRGGGFSSEQESLRLKIRGRFPMEHRWNGLGFRLVRTLFPD